MTDYASIDNNLAKSQLLIGEASNLAQLALTYTYNFENKKYDEYVCILSCLAQIAIDNAKRKYDVDVGKEIYRIKKDMDIIDNGYPKFWLDIRRGFDKTKINKDLVCPMNYLHDIQFKKIRSASPTLPMNYFIQKYDLLEGRRKSKKVENLIEKYSLELYNAGKDEEYLLLKEDFEEMIIEIRSIYLSKSYVGLMSWLIHRAFVPTQTMRSNMQSKLDKNKSLLLKTLYCVNQKNLLSIFSKNMIMDKTMETRVND